MVEVSQRDGAGRGGPVVLEAGCEGLPCRGKNTGESGVMVVTAGQAFAWSLLPVLKLPSLMLYK